MSAAAPAPDTPVSSIAEAIARMEAIEAALPEPDGIACFNRMYLDVRQSFESGAELAADRHLSAVVNLIGNWTINSARDLAWNNCLLLWSISGDPVARELFLAGLAASTALASRMLLVAV